MSMRRFALNFKISRTTVKRKVEFLAQQARLNQEKWLKEQPVLFQRVEFDDLETFEHTKCKPVTVTMFLESNKNRILGYTVARIGAKGLLAKISRKKYGRRRNESFKKRDELFKRMKPYIAKDAVIKSDKHPHYLRPLKKYFPHCEHKIYKGRKGCVTGQGELKRGGYDPLFKVNQNFAMIRYGLKRLSRKTWCTTKKLEALDNHLAIYMDYHNQFLKVHGLTTKKVAA